MKMKTFKSEISIAAPSAMTAARKKSALEQLSQSFSASELTALAKNGPKFLDDPLMGPEIRRQLGM